MKLTRTTGIVVAALALGLGTGIAAAQIPDPATGTITSCYAGKGGAVRIIDTGAACKSGETKLTWNQHGNPGTNGTNGTNGVSGYTRVSDSGTYVFPGDEPFVTAGVTCPTGRKVLGGGGNAAYASGHVYIASSYPSSDTNWQVTFGFEGGNGNFPEGSELHWNVFATCATAN
jgi:hypothetical protein